MKSSEIPQFVIFFFITFRPRVRRKKTLEAGLTRTSQASWTRSDCFMVMFMVKIYVCVYIYIHLYYSEYCWCVYEALWLAVSWLFDATELQVVFWNCPEPPWRGSVVWRETRDAQAENWIQHLQFYHEWMIYTINPYGWFITLLYTVYHRMGVGETNTGKLTRYLIARSTLFSGFDSTLTNTTILISKAYGDARQTWGPQEKWS